MDTKINFYRNRYFSKTTIFSFLAIIGGGIGGTSCAYWLRKSAGDSIEIDLYNYGKIGGRIAVVEVNGKFYEAGASILHPDNLYMKNWAEEFGKQPG